jgi:Zn-dependent protease with chaperone function
MPYFIIKPLSFLLAYIISSLNAILIFAPAIVMTALVMRYGYRIDEEVIKMVVYKSLLVIQFFLSSFMSLYIILDYIFGITVMKYRKKCINVSRSDKFGYIGDIFKKAESKFDSRSIDFYIQASENINAFAVGSMRKNVIILTTGIINFIKEKTEDKKQQDNALAGIIGHEISHIINMDFLPGMVMHVNEISTRFVFRCLDLLFHSSIFLFSFIPILGRIAKLLIKGAHKLTEYICDKLIDVTDALYEFFRRWISRKIEYRSDMDSAQAMGGLNIYTALTFLDNGDSSVLDNIFSTHPRIKSRIVRVAKVRESNEIVTSGAISDLTNVWGICLLLCLSVFFAQKSEFWLLPDYFTTAYSFVYEWVMKQYNGIMTLISTVQGMYDTLAKFKSMFKI